MTADLNIPRLPRPVRLARRAPFSPTVGRWLCENSKACSERRGRGRSAACSTSWWSNPSCSPTTRSATPRAGRCTSTGRPASSSTTAKPLPSVYVIQGFTGQLDMWLSHSPLEPNMIERLDAMFTSRACPDAIIVFVDCWTTLGGSQFLNSPRHRPLPGLPVRRGRAVHRRALSDAVRRAITAGIAGKSSGGYGAMVVPMLRPDVFGALASHAGDALFECCYLPAFRSVARGVARPLRGLVRGVLRAPRSADHFDFATVRRRVGDVRLCRRRTRLT